MTETYRVDKTRLSGITGDERSLASMESILGMPIPEVNADLRTQNRKKGRMPVEERAKKIAEPVAADKTFELDFPSREAAKEFTQEFNYCLVQFSHSRGREYEAGELSYRHRGMRFFHLYSVYCEKHELKLKRCVWDGGSKVKVHLSTTADKKTSTYDTLEPSSSPQPHHLEDDESVCSEPSLTDPCDCHHLTP